MAPSAAASSRPLRPAGAGLSPTERYLFDLEGYLVMPSVFSDAEVAAVRAGARARDADFQQRSGALRLSGESQGLRGDGVRGREDLAGVLSWEDEGGDVLRSVLAHPALAPVLNELLGDGYRMDHWPFLLRQGLGAEGFALHGGATAPDGTKAWDLSYDFNSGQQRTTLLALAVQLTDTGPGDGGFCIVRGSHKSNLPCPKALEACEPGMMEHVYQPSMRAGDVMIFTEASTHGTLPWTRDDHRLTALYRFAPAQVAYSRSYYPEWPGLVESGLFSEAQKAVLLPPFHTRLDRPVVRADASAEVPAPRAAHKKSFDEKVFGTAYF